MFLIFFCHTSKANGQLSAQLNATQVTLDNTTALKCELEEQVAELDAKIASASETNVVLETTQAELVDKMTKSIKLVEHLKLKLETSESVATDLEAKLSTTRGEIRCQIKVDPMSRYI